VDNANPMNILDACDKLMKHFDSLMLANPLIFYDIVEQLALLHVFHDEEELLWCLDDLVKLYDIGVPY